MPVYNGAADVPKAVDSILTQTFQDFELIAVNDGSTDTTASVLDAIAVVSPRVRVIHQENVGIARTLNRGMALARGRYIARMDHDDRAKPMRFAKQVAYLDANPGCAIVGTRAEIWVGDKPTVRVHDHPIDDAALRFELLFDNYFVHSSVMLRKAAVDAVGGYNTDPTRPSPEDYEFWSRLARRFDIANLPERLSIYREVPSSISRTGVQPFQIGVLAISSENLAAAVGEQSVRDVHKDIAALIHGAYEKLSPEPDLSAMCRVIEEAGFRITARAPESDIPARVAARIALLRRHHAEMLRRTPRQRQDFKRLIAAISPSVRSRIKRYFRT